MTSWVSTTLSDQWGESKTNKGFVFFLFITWMNIRCFNDPKIAVGFVHVCCSVAKSCVTLCDPMDYNYQAPLSMGFSGQEYWSGLPFPPPGDLPHPGIKPTSPALRGRFFTTEPPGKYNLCVYSPRLIKNVGTSTLNYTFSQNVVLWTSLLSFWFSSEISFSILPIAPSHPPSHVSEVLKHWVLVPNPAPILFPKYLCLWTHCSYALGIFLPLSFLKIISSINMSWCFLKEFIHFKKTLYLNILFSRYCAIYQWDEIE